MFRLIRLSLLSAAGPGLFLALRVAAALADPVPTFQFEWGRGPGSPVQFVDPIALAADDSYYGTFVIVDAGASRFYRFDFTGRLTQQWLSTVSLAGARSIAIAAGQSSVWVADTSHDRILRFPGNGGSPDLLFGTRGSGPGQFDRPIAVADFDCYPCGDIYVADAGNHRIQRFNNNGEFVSEFGSYGTGPGQFVDLIGLAFDATNQRLYAADRATGRVQAFSASGNFLTAWGGPGQGPGLFGSISGLGVGGGVFVLDDGTQSVQKFDINGNWLVTWGQPGSAPGEFLGPTGLVAAGSNQYFVLDRGNRRIQVFDADPTRGPLAVEVSTTPTPAEGTAPLLVGFRATPSGGFPPYGVSWSFDDGTVLSGTAVQHRFQSPGTYAVHLDLVDHGNPSGRSLTREVQVTVRPAAMGVPRLLTHLTTPSSKNVCQPPLPADCSLLKSNGELASAAGPFYFLYVVVEKGLLPSVGGVQFGISYSPGGGSGGDHAGVDVFEWRLCGDYQFKTGTFTQPGEGNLITWSGPPRCPTSPLAVAGYFYLAAYSPDSFRLIPRPADALAAVSDCDAREYHLSAAGLGYASFSAGGVVSGYNPCQANPTPVRPTTWSAIKGQYAPR